MTYEKFGSSAENTRCSAVRTGSLACSTIFAPTLERILPVDEEYTNHRLTIWIKKTKVPLLSHIVRRFCCAR
jgi:hypothetical protein